MKQNNMKHLVLFENFDTNEKSNIMIIDAGSYPDEYIESLGITRDVLGDTELIVNRTSAGIEIRIKYQDDSNLETVVELEASDISTILNALKDHDADSALEITVPTIDDEDTTLTYDQDSKMYHLYLATDYDMPLSFVDSQKASVIAILTDVLSAPRAKPDPVISSKIRLSDFDSAIPEFVKVKSNPNVSTPDFSAVVEEPDYNILVTIDLSIKDVQIAKLQVDAYDKSDTGFKTPIYDTGYAYWKSLRGIDRITVDNYMEVDSFLGDRNSKINDRTSEILVSILNCIK